MRAPVTVCHRSSMLLSSGPPRGLQLVSLSPAGGRPGPLALDVCIWVVLLFAQLFSAVT